MIGELRRRAYLTAMQVVSWLPRTELPFAAPSRAELLQPLPAEDVAVAPPVPAAAPTARVTEPAAPAPSLPRVQLKPARAEPPVAPVSEAQESAEPAPVKLPVPRFALQLYRAGNCLLLVELPTGEPFQSRDPAYLLLKDLLRAAGLPDAPQLLGEPVRWPLLARGNLDQGPQAAREFVQGYVMARVEEQEQAPASIWLIGLTALRFSGEAEADSYEHELSIDGIGSAWAVPGLELLMDEPERKAPLWRAMCRVRSRWEAS